MSFLYYIAFCSQVAHVNLKNMPNVGLFAIFHIIFIKTDRKLIMIKSYLKYKLVDRSPWPLILFFNTILVFYNTHHPAFPL